MARAALAPFDPFREFSPIGGGLAEPFSMLREMNRLMDDTFQGIGLRTAMAPMVSARMNVSETENQIKATIELPGVSEKDVEVRIDDGVLTISGEKKEEQTEEKENYHFMERSYGAFRRSIQLPSSADTTQVRATFDKGVLTVVVPKNPQQERSCKIPIQVGSSS